MASAISKRTDLGEVLGARLRGMRRVSGLTQVQFCELTGLSQTRVSTLERGIGWGNLPRIWAAMESAGLSPLGLFLPDMEDPELAELMQTFPTLPAAQRQLVLGMIRQFSGD